jgi:hypothetical protein
VKKIEGVPEFGRNDLEVPMIGKLIVGWSTY